MQRAIEGHVGPGKQVEQLDGRDVQSGLAIQFAAIEADEGTVVGTQTPAFLLAGGCLLVDGHPDIAIQGIRALATQLPLPPAAHPLQHLQLTLAIQAQQLVKFQRGQAIQLAHGFVFERSGPVQQQALQVHPATQGREAEIIERELIGGQHHRRRINQPHTRATTEIHRIERGPVDRFTAGQRQRTIQPYLQAVLAHAASHTEVVLGG